MIINGMLGYNHVVQRNCASFLLDYYEGEVEA